MGIVEKILSKKKIDKDCKINTNKTSVELSENFHFHYRNSRIEFDHNEWKKISHQIIKSYFKWLIMFKPKSGDIDSSGKQIFLSNSIISNIPGEKNDFIRSDEIRVELQKWADYIHVHYKSLRIEFTIDEFLEFANSMEEGKKILLKDFKLKDIPKRIGTHHFPCPRGRVNFKNKNFWTEAGDDNNLNDKHKSIYLNKDDETYMKKNFSIIGNNMISNFLIKLILKFPRLGKLIGVRIK